MIEFHPQTQETGIISREFGDGWLSDAAHDYVAVAVNLAGFPADLVARKLITANVGRKLNIRTIERVLGEVEADLED